MRNTLSIACGALCIALLAGCTSSDAEPAEEPTTPNVEAATSSATSDTGSNDQTSPRGNLVKKTGDPASMFIEGQESEPVMNFVVKGIEVDPACTSEYAMPAENGHFVTIDLDVETGTPEQFEEAFSMSDYTMSFSNWKFVDANGTTANTTSSGPAYGCLTEAEYLPSAIGAGERATGKVVLDLPTTDGHLIYEEPLSFSGWEWEIPVS